MIKKSRKHLEEVNQKYFEHGIFSIKQGFYIIAIGFTFIIHGFVPALFPFFTPRRILSIAKMIKERNVPGECEEI